VNDPACLDLADLSASIATGRISSVEATRACLARIEAWQPHINAFIRLDADEALRTAAERDVERAGGRSRGPLHGVPLAHKDLLFRQGKVSTAGSRILRDTVAGTTSTLLKRLDRAGAIDLGTLNMAEFAAGPTGHNVHFGHARNPYDRTRITGGSSSGSGAAVGARMVYGALGSDTGGSIRLPAGACNVVGLKPTYGRISRHGTVARSWSLDHIGPLARTARDCALIFQAIAGHDPRDTTSSHRPVPDMADFDDRSLEGITIGMADAGVLSTLDPAVAALIAEAGRVLVARGATQRTVSLPALAELASVGETIIKSEAAAMHRDWIRTRPQDYATQVRYRIEAGFYIPATQYIDALRLRAVLTERFIADTMQGIDLLLMPLIPMPLPTIEETDVEGRSGDEVMAMVRGLTTFTRPFNLLGLPAVSVPCGFDPSGLPVAFQLVGRPFDDMLCLACAAAFQAETRHHRVEPKL
jgi:aspartyl-tRNA(Asn)/glutamyl-tRNA(Gln) amidotransferase subunit A